MRISVTFRHTEPTDALKEYAETKFGKAKKYLEEPLQAEVVLTVEKFRHIAEINLRADGTVFNGTESSDNMYSSIDLVADKLERQIKKHKTKGKSKAVHARNAAQQSLGKE
ncbi:MAG: ribosome-associated translation inhibitor RaiA [Candidatus Alcyoniella australis]|nr:ribosome-associated translation inhibitor RaiA [Candidatus Alcyoniella australis]